jgi:hypothetical protein
MKFGSPYLSAVCSSVGARSGSLQEFDQKNTKLLAFNVTYSGLL